MSPASALLYGVAFLWIIGGSAWLLKHRSYGVRDVPKFGMDLLGFPVELSQSLFGRAGVPYAFLLPNMVIFGLFTFLPVILNFYVSFTGGSSISIFERPWVGGSNYNDIFDCESIFRPNTCTNAGFTFWTSLFNTLWFVVVQVPLLVGVALITALVVNKSLIGRGFWRAMFFYPVMLSPVVIANIWKWILDRRGVLNAALDASADQVAAVAGLSGFGITMAVLVAVGLMLTAERTLRSGREPSLAWGALFAVLFMLVLYWSDPAAIVPGLPTGAVLFAGLIGSGAFLWAISVDHPALRFGQYALCIVAVALLLAIQFDAVFDISGFRPINWLVTLNTGWSFFWINFVFTWSHMGFYMLILLAGLQAIPTDLYEAAKMDGTRPTRAFWRITLPLLTPTLTVVVVLAMIRSFQVFDEVYLLTGGGPGRETFMIVQNIFEEAFAGSSPLYGIAAAGSVLMAIVIGVFTAVQLFVTRRRSGI